MKHFLVSLYLVEYFLHTSAQCTVPASEFQLAGNYLIGGLFDIHKFSGTDYHERPQSIDCSRFTFILASYRRFQLMRFAVEEINNSTSLLPNVSLGYQLFDHCSNAENFPSIISLISVNKQIQPWKEPENLSTQSKIIATVGPFSSADTLTVAPLFMADFIPMVGYAAASTAFSQKIKYPSYLRTAHSNKDVINVIVEILKYFDWRWVAFLNSDDAYGIDSLEMFIRQTADTDICLAFNNQINLNTNFQPIFKLLHAQRVPIIIVFAPKLTAEALIESALQMNVSNKVWLAGDTWSRTDKLLKRHDIGKVGTVLGVSQLMVSIPGFREFVSLARNQSRCENVEQQTFCNQICNCSQLKPEEIIAADPSFSFPVYSAVYAIAHALHNTLQCGTGRCIDNITVHPHMVLAQLKKSNFTLLDRTIRFHENGDPQFGSYSIVLWKPTGGVEEIGLSKSYPSVHFFINETIIQRYDGKVPIAQCSPECPAGYSKKLDGNHKCCFSCEMCLNGTYVNITEDPYTCVACKETEWSTVASTSCKLRSVEYTPFTDSGAIVIMVAAGAFVGLILAMSVLFAINFNTPVVRSAGGPMCFLILGCLCLCTISVFFYFGKPTTAFCILRFLPFYLFYTPCLACFVVRSFQIVCVFKIAAKFPKLHSLWMKHNGQWVVITVAFVTQVFFLLIGYAVKPHRPHNETVWYPDKIVMGCDLNLGASYAPVVLLLSLCSLCFIFSYMGKDLPKNYNEAKTITFCLLLLILTWTIFATVSVLYRGKFIQILNALAILSSLYCFLLWYFLPKCYIIIFHPEKNTQQYFQGLIQSYTKTMSQ